MGVEAGVSSGEGVVSCLVSCESTKDEKICFAFSQHSYINDLLQTFEPRREKTGLRGFRPGLTQTSMYCRHRSVKFRKKEGEGFYYPYSENKGADQLLSYCKADLPLSFRTGKNPVFS